MDQNLGLRKAVGIILAKMMGKSGQVNGKSALG